jgi:hypothetical protein
MEEWRSILSLPGYSASSLGRVRREPFDKPMPNGGFYRHEAEERSASEDKNGRRKLTIGPRTYNVAALVCEAFHGPRPFPRAEAMHLDENPANDLPGNLAWGTRRENMNALKLKAWQRSARQGERHNNAKLSDADVAAIRQARGARSATDLAAAYAIRREYVHQLWAGQARRNG